MDPVERLLRALVRAQRQGNAITKEVIDDLRSAFDEIAAEIARRDLPNLSGLVRKRETDALMKDVGSTVRASIKEVRKLLRERLAAVGASQAQDTLEVLRGATSGGSGFRILTTGLGVNTMKVMLDTDPFQGEVLAGWADSVGEATVARVRRAINSGLVQNETIDQIVRRVRGRRVAGGSGYAGGVWSSTTRDAEAVVRTAVNFIGNRSTLEAMKANADILTGFRFVATLDSRTSEICMAHDGREWKIDADDVAVPPLHFNCRSVLVPVIDWKGVGLPDPPEGDRASMFGPVPSEWTYEDWLGRQGSELQDDILGPRRAKLFRDGKISLRDLIRKDRTVVPVKELEE